MVSFLVGVLLVSDSGVELGVSGVLRVLGGLAVVGPLIGGSWIVYNQIADLEEDSSSPRKKDLVLVRGILTPRHAWAVFFSLLGIGLVLSFALGTRPGLLALGASFIGLAYSHPLMRLKARPFLDSAANGICYGVVPLAMGWSLFSGLSIQTIGASLPLFLIFSSGHMLLALPDRELDKRLGVRTTPVIVGYRATVLVSITLVTLAIGTLTALVAVGWYPRYSLITLPILGSILGLHISLLDESKIQRRFGNLRHLYAALGAVFLITLII